MLQLLGRATSGNVQKVLFLLEEMGLPYDRKDYGRIFENTTTSPEYKAMNPTQKVPTLIDGELSIWESHTIMRYLAAKHNNPAYPADLAARTQVERWMDWTLGALNPAFMAGFRDAKKTAEERGADTVKNLITELQVIDGHLANREWLAGDTISLADMCMGPVARRCLAFPFDLPALPNVRAWCARLEQRPAFMKAVAAG
ncbi:MAG: glutathione S-transferase family protein [Pseudomonadota bacterium]